MDKTTLTNKKWKKKNKNNKVALNKKKDKIKIR